jgi:hypothetical protein
MVQNIMYKRASAAACIDRYVQVQLFDAPPGGRTDGQRKNASHSEARMGNVDSYARVKGKRAQLFISFSLLILVWENRKAAQCMAKA